MRDWHNLLFLLSLIVSIASSNITVSVKVPAYSALTFYISPLPIMPNSTIILSVNYSTNTSGEVSSTQIFSSAFILSNQTKYRIWNFEKDEQNMQINLQDVASGGSSSKLSQNMVWVDSVEGQSVFLAVFDQGTTSGFMLPFNMLSLKTLNIYVVEYNPSVKQSSYNLEPFMATYWTEKKSSTELMTYLPYLSECTIQNSFIQINDLLQPTDCWLSDFGLECSQKKMDFDCVLEELEVSNVDAEYWFNNNNSNLAFYIDILYYLLPYQMSLTDLGSAKQNLDGVSALILTIFDDLVPVYYTRSSQNPILVNEFHFTFQVTIEEGSQLQMHIVSAEIVGSYNAAISTPYAHAQIHVKYLNLFERFNAYDLPAIWYIGFAFLMVVVLGGALLTVSVYVCGMHLKLIVKVREVLMPAAKGSFYTLATGGCFFALINQLSFRTNYSSISPLYGGSLADQDLQLNNIGRNGLTVALVGVYLMSSAIKQACQVQSAEKKDLKVVFQDDGKLEGRSEMSEEQLQERIYFAKKNIVSQQKYILLSSLLMAFIGFWYVELMLSLDNWQVGLILVTAVPIISKILNELMIQVIVKELLYMSGNLLSLVLTSYLLLLKSRSIIEFTYIYIARFFHLYVETMLIEFAYGKFIDHLESRIYSNPSDQPNYFYAFLGKIFYKSIEFRRKQSVYQKGIYIGSLMAMEVMAVTLLPLFGLTVHLLTRTTLFESNLLMGKIQSRYALVMLLTLMPLDLLMIAIFMQIMKKRGMRMEEVIRFNRFRFRRRKFPWLNDQFSLSRTVHFFYRQYEKFGFSSQLYFVVSLFGFSEFLLYLGMLIIIESGYLPGNDPVMLLILTLVVLIGDTSSLVLPLVAKKLRLYYKRQEQAMRVNLLKTDKYLRNNTDTIEYYLTLQGVKEFFLDYNAEWIVHNLPNIFSKQDFEENGGELINRYKHYKSLFKKRQIDEKRRIKRLKEDSVMTSPAFLPPDPQIALPRRPFLLLGRPLVTYWLYLARQSLYLKSIVASVRRDKMSKNCEFCNMDVELQALQRRDFQQIVNQFRLLNVNKVFDPAAFLEYYRLNQKYVTICVECKEKNLHLQGKISLKSVPAKLVKRWHLIAKSYLLHPSKYANSTHNR